MRTVSRTLLGLGLAALIAGPAAAQGPGRGMGARMGSPSGLLVNESVQKELKLDDKQIAKSKELDEKINEERREKFQALQDSDGQERFEKMRELGNDLNASALKQAAEFLRPEQVERLGQIAYQVRGPMAFGEPEVARKLKLTDAQKAKVQEILREFLDEARKIFQESQDDRDAAMKKLDELRKRTLDKLVSLLNDEQKKIWKEMLGAPFEIRYQ